MLKIKSSIYEIEYTLSVEDKDLTFKKYGAFNEYVVKLSSTHFDFIVNFIVSESKKLICLSFSSIDYARQYFKYKSDNSTDKITVEWFVNIMKEEGFPLIKNDLNSDEIREITEGRKLSAVKMVKDRLGCGLKEAKDIVDRY